MLNDTHDPKRTSWVESANDPDAEFPLQNLPLGVFSIAPDRTPRIGVAIGKEILDLAAVAAAGLMPSPAIAAACGRGSLNEILAAGPGLWSTLRHRLSELLGADTCKGETRSQLQRHLVPQSRATMLLPAAVGDYTDFYASIHHATRVGRLFRPDHPLLPNYKWVPIGYHGRASSLVASPAPIRRPLGQSKDAADSAPRFGPCQSLDFEVELGALVGPGNPLGEPVSLAAAQDHLFGVVLLNDWSARDLQSWEYQPLGPFLAKNFATSLSPWVVTMEALAPFRVPAAPRPAGDPAPLPYLSDAHDAAQGALDVMLEAWLLTPAMKAAHAAPQRLSSANFRQMYWTFGQMLAHHTSNGCNLQPGDLLGSGTVSGDTDDARSCLLELTARGAEPIKLANGESRRFLEDGDEVILRGYAARAGARRIGLGECRGIVLPAAGQSSSGRSSKR